MLDILKTVFNPQPVNRVEMDGTKIKQEPQSAKDAQEVGILIRQLLLFVKIVQLEDIKTKTGKVVAGDVIVDNIKTKTGKLLAKTVVAGNIRTNTKNRDAKTAVRVNIKTNQEQQPAKTVVAGNIKTK
tara:strand:- start:740 stop:1123 length:384 start_codon:yes stop_codon:yes gene_type:complete